MTNNLTLKQLKKFVNGIGEDCDNYNVVVNFSGIDTRELNEIALNMSDEVFELNPVIPVDERIEAIAFDNELIIIKEKLVEELNELLLGIEKNDEVNIVEEIADVFVMSQEYLTFKRLHEDYYKQVDYKLNRTLKLKGLKI